MWMPKRCTDMTASAVSVGGGLDRRGQSGHRLDEGLPHRSPRRSCCRYTSRRSGACPPPLATRWRKRCLFVAIDHLQRDRRLGSAVDGEGHRPRRRPLVSLPRRDDRREGHRLAHRSRARPRTSSVVVVGCALGSVVVVGLALGATTVCVGSDPLPGLTFMSPLSTR